MKAKFCPIFTIGFAPPKKGQTDMRTCKPDCEWFNEDNECCELHLVREYLEEIIKNTADIVDLNYDKTFELTYDDF